MKHRAAALLWVAVHTFLLAPLSPLWAQSFVPVADKGLNPPQIQHQPAEQATVSGEPLEIEAVIAADASVEAVVLYRRVGASEYTHLKMRDKGDGLFRARIPGKEMVPPGIEYFIQATDAFGNMTTYGQPLPSSVFKMIPLTAKVEAKAAPDLPSEDQAFTERVFPSETAVLDGEPPAAGSPWYKKWWVWTIVGAVAAGIAVASSGGGGSGDPGAGAPTTGTLTITGPVPGSP